MTNQPFVPRPAANTFLRDGLLSLVALFLVFAAFDDITTDRSTSFRAEYTALVLCAAWFLAVALRLLSVHRTVLGAISLVALGAALWGQRGIGPGITPGFWPEYVATTAACVWFLVLAIVLIWLGRRHAPAISPAS
jgi:hypothetical protein